MATGPILRREFVRAGIAAAGWPLPAQAADTDAERFAAPATNDLLVRVADDATIRVVTPADLQIDAAPLRVWPMQPALRIVRNGTRFNQILLLRLATDPIAGLAAFSAICTHAACVVSGWDGVSHQLVCPCHASVYAARQAAAVVSGPAARPLPGLPLKFSDGVLKVASGFSGRVGGDTSRTM